MRLLVTGANGQLGRALALRAPATGHDLIGVDLPEVDICDERAVVQAVASARPDVIVNCAAFTAVDRAEAAEAAALAVNGTAVGYLAAAADTAGALLVQISTDYVFGGQRHQPIGEDEPVAPLSAYGRTKLVGEEAARTARRHLIIRTAWLYGEGNNFVAAIRRQIASGIEELRVVDDQYGSPTWAEDLATAVFSLIDIGAGGVVHAVNSGATSWYGFAHEIVRLLGAPVSVVPVPTGEFLRPARRPAFSVLATGKLEALLGAPMPPWQDALRRFLNQSVRTGARIE